MAFRIYCQQCGEDLREHSSEPIFADTGKRDQAGHKLYELDTSRYYCGCNIEQMKVGEYGLHWAIENTIEPLYDVLRGWPMRDHVTIYLVPDVSVGMKGYEPNMRQMGHSNDRMYPGRWRKFLEHFLRATVLPGD